jgi:hypothetical protein
MVWCNPAPGCKGAGSRARLICPARARIARMLVDLDVRQPSSRATASALRKHFPCYK